MMSAYEDLYEPWSKSSSRCSQCQELHRRQPLGSPATFMSDPEFAVTPVPASRNFITHEHAPCQASSTKGRVRSRARSRSTRRRSSSLGRSAQGHAPRRSVSSMKILFPLTLSPTFQTETNSMDMSTTPNAESICSSAGTNEMDLINNEPLADCNFPEMLVRDLETSEVVFRTKSMTAGFPSVAFATSSQDEHGPQPGRAIPRPPTPMYQFSDDKPRSNSLIASRLGPYDEPSDEEHAVGRRESTDSLSMGSDGMDPPPSIRMRGHSVTTAATSVSGRRSSSFSQKAHSRSSPSTPPSSPAMAQPLHGTWFDADGEADATISSRVQESSHVEQQSRDVQSLIGGHSADTNTFSYNDGMARHTEAIAYHLRPNSPNSHERPCTPSSQISQLIRERPRIINIPPTAIPKRKSSLNRGHIRTMSSSSMAPSVHEMPGRTSMGQLAPSASMQVLGARHGEKPGETSRPPSRGRDGDDHVYTWRSDGVFFPGNLSDDVFLDDDEEMRSTGVYNQLLHTKQRTPSFDGKSPGSPATHIPEILRTAHLTTSYTTPGIPLPPDVLEVLRVSISCFPETMLTTSSLTIDNIRAYSKKLRHGGMPECDLIGDDRSLYSSAESGLKPQPLKKWRLYWFGQSHKTNKQQQHQRQQSQAIARNSVDVDALGTARSLRKTAGASWRPIRAIFPFGSDYLCDALYAHVLAYNYISTLLPPPLQPLRPQASRPAVHCPSGSSLDDPSSKTRVPKKAASVLGMQDNNVHYRPTTASGGPHHRHSRSHRFLRRDSHGRSSLRSRGSTASGFEGNGNNSVASGIRELHKGLAKCIALLVSTLKKTEMGDLQGIESGGDANTLLSREREVQDESGEVDVLLLRALCEVVRISEA
ncbi:hypothetical protein QBC36DRAFT_317916 [Triangularia setosa]|uniref:Uncharacterized protein n=1 Tax=Triangularia setosa TaxID=2587417 RepID=A0AAN6WGQ8_9PEZI|nr:hypothetical protein QBC36DRAFT_317916 [Podospora setosa]